MGVYTYVCRKSGGEWKGKQRGEEEKEAIEASAETTYDLQRKLVHSSLSKDISSAGFVSSSFSLVTPSSAVFQLICTPNVRNMDIAFMKLALQKAKIAMDSLEVPVGCVIVEGGEVISSGRNRTTETRNATRHAEMEAIDFLLEQWHRNGLSQKEISEKFSNCTLYVTCEPCIMCASALSILGIKEVFYGCANDKFGGCGSILSLQTSSSQQFASDAVQQQKGFKCSGGIMAEEAVSLFRSFYEQGNPNAPKPHRPLVQKIYNQDCP